MITVSNLKAFLKPFHRLATISGSARVIVLLASALSALGAHSQGATSVTRNDVTWKFDSNYPAGVFANGDPYVVAPNGLTITSITPQWDGTKNGSVVNPKPVGRSHGFDTRVSNVVYDEEINDGDDLPLFVSTNSSIVSSVGRETKSSSKRTWMDSVEVLTILPEAPPPNSFRPPYAGTDKTIRGQVDSIDWSWVKDLAHPSDVRTPNPALGNVQLDLIMQWQTSELKTENTEHTYGRGIAYEVATSLLWLHLSNPKEEKLPTMINLVQRGIDTFGIVKSINDGFWPNGGHNVGRKLPVLVAARAFNDSEIMSYSTSVVPGSDRRRWQEDGQHFYVQQWQIGVQPPQADRPPYEQEHLGMPDWTSNAVTEINGATPAWWGFRGSGYRLVNGAPNVGQVIAAEISGLRDDWDWEPYFDYIEDQFWPNMQDRIAYSNNSVYPFHAEMWRRYKEGDYVEEDPPTSNRTSAPTISPTGGAYLSPQTVEISSNDPSADIYYTLDGTTPTPSSSRYAAPIVIETTATLRAIAATTETDISTVSLTTYSINEFSSGEDWSNVELGSLPQRNEIAFTATPSSASIDTVFGFAGQAASAYSQLACIVRFNSDGYIDARDGSSYRALTPLAYVADETYLFIVKIDTTQKLYSVQVRDSEGVQSVIADSYAFRAEASDTSEITHFATRSLYDESSHVAGLEAIDYDLAVSNVRVPSIEIAPEGGSYSAMSLEVSLSSDQNDALLYYTLDGSDPEPGAPSTFLFEETLLLGQSSEVRAIATTEDGAASEPISRVFSVNEYNSGNDWTSVSLSSANDRISVAMLVTPSTASVDAVVGLSESEANDYSDLACIVRFNSSGKIDARDGGQYRSASDLSYFANEEYLVTFYVDLNTSKYFANVKTADGTVHQIAQGFGFRTESIDTEAISFFNTRTLDPGSAKVSGISIEDTHPSPPAPTSLLLSSNNFQE